MAEESDDLVYEICGDAMADEDLLRDHHDMQANRCPACGSEFTTEALLAGHRRMHGNTSAADDVTILEQQGERKP